MSEHTYIQLQKDLNHIRKITLCGNFEILTLYCHRLMGLDFGELII